MYLVVIPTCFLSICRRLIVFPLNFFSSFTYCFPLKNSFIFFQPIVWGQFRRQLYCGWFKDHSVAKSRDWITGKPFSYLFILCSLQNKHILSSKYFFMFRLVITNYNHLSKQKKLCSHLPTVIELRGLQDPKELLTMVRGFTIDSIPTPMSWAPFGSWSPITIPASPRGR